MARMNGQTPEELAANIVEDQIVTVSSDALDALDLIVRYEHRDDLAAVYSESKREALWDSSVEAWRKDELNKLVRTRANGITSYLETKARNVDARNAYIREMVARGVDPSEARKIALGK